MQDLNIAEKFNANQFGIHSQNLGFVNECNTVRKFYEFYDGRSDKKLEPGDEPKACFALCEGEKFVAAYAYCNLHSLWKS